MNKQFLVALSAFALFALAPLASAAAGSTPMATIRQAVIAFNQGDYKGWAAACASPAQITDDFPPHIWNGPTACSDWVAAFEALVKKQNITNPTVVFGSPWHVDITGNLAYVVLPATFHYNQNGKPVKESGSVMTIVLKKSSAGWLMTAWTWAQH